MSRFEHQLTLGELIPEATRRAMLKLAVGIATRKAHKARLTARAISAKRDTKGRFQKTINA